MHPYRVELQSDRCSAPGPSGQDRTQESILDPDQRHPGAGGDTLSPPGGRACAPDQDAIAGPGQAKAQLMPSKLQHTVQPPVAQEAQVLMIKPPGHPAQCEGALRWAEAQLFRFAVSARPVAADVEPVIAPSVFCHCTKGASVT